MSSKLKRKRKGKKRRYKRGQRWRLYKCRSPQILLSSLSFLLTRCLNSRPVLTLVLIFLQLLGVVKVSCGLSGIVYVIPVLLFNKVFLLTHSDLLIQYLFNVVYVYVVFGLEFGVSVDRRAASRRFQ